MTQTWNKPHTAQAIWGRDVAGAGDVNGDGYDDVAVSRRTPQEIELHLFRGSSSGVQSSSSWSDEVPRSLEHHPRMAEADLNGDGYDDLIVGFWKPRPGSPDGGYGEVRVYFGSPSGLSSTPDWTASREGRRFGSALDSAGDLNGDGYDDLVVGDPYAGGCPFLGGDEGGPPSRVYVYYGSASGLPDQSDWSYSHDNDDYVSCLAQTGGVAGLGDVNGDGYDDLFVGAPYYKNADAGQGRGFVFYGSSSGLDAEPDWTRAHPQAKKGEDALFGHLVAEKVDIHGDGYNDLIVIGAGEYSGEPGPNQRHFLFEGSSSGLEKNPSWIHSFNALVSDSIGAGDIDGDGVDDVVLPISEYTLGLFYGSSSGLIEPPGWTEGAKDMGPDYGSLADAAGDVNDDGYADIIVASRHSGAFVFQGGPNPPPSASDVSVQTPRGTEVVVELAGSDPAGDPLDFEVVSEPDDGTVGEVVEVDESTAEVAYTPDGDFQGTDSFEFRVADPYANTATGTVEVVVGGAPTFVEPTPDGPLTARVGERLAFEVVAEDPDGDSLTLGVEPIPDGASFDAESGRFEWTPSAEEVGTRELELTADDGVDRATRTLEVTVEPADDTGDMADAGLSPEPDVAADTETGEPDASPTDLAAPDATSKTSGAPGDDGCGCTNSSTPAPGSIVWWLVVAVVVVGGRALSSRVG